MTDEVLMVKGKPKRTGKKKVRYAVRMALYLSSTGLPRQRRHNFPGLLPSALVISRIKQCEVKVRSDL